MEKKQESTTSNNLPQLRDVIERLQRMEKNKETTVIRFEIFTDGGFITHIHWDSVIERKYDK